MPWVIGAVAVVVVLIIIGAVVGDSDDEEEGGPGVLDIARVELEMSWYCDAVDGWEHIALWLLGHPEAQIEDPSDDREVAERVVMLDHTCEYWKAKGNSEMASLFKDDPGALARFDAHLESIGKAKILAEIDRIESALPTLRANRERMRQLDRVLGE